MFANKPRRVANSHLAASSVVRLIEAMKPPTEDQPGNVILKPKDIKKNIPGTQLLIKLAKQREKEKEKKAVARALPTIDKAAVDEAIAGIIA
jgi:hypothetical protein